MIRGQVDPEGDEQQLEMNQGKLLGIAVRSKSRAEMQPLSCIEITTDAGCAGDFRGKPGNRQVTMLSREAWESACTDLGRELPWTSRRANLLIEGINLANQTDALITIGDVELQVSGETDPCGRMDEVASGLRKALIPDWRGGVCCRVIKGGSIQVGDGVSISVRQK